MRNPNIILAKQWKIQHQLNKITKQSIPKQNLKAKCKLSKIMNKELIVTR